MKIKNLKTGYGERDTADLKFALMKKSWIVVSRGQCMMAHLVERTVGFEAGWTKRDSISDVGYHLNGWGSG